MNDQFLSKLNKAIATKNADLIPAPTTKQEFIIMLDALAIEAKKLNQILDKNGQDLATIHGCKKPKEVLPHGVTTNAQSPFWALGAVYHNPNLKD